MHFEEFSFIETIERKENEMSSPQLKVALFAGQTEVATSDDPAIWLATMAAITGMPTASPAGTKERTGLEPILASNPAAPTGAMGKFAEELGVSVDELDGACSPSSEPPYAILDNKHWEALKQNTPPRGPGSVPGVVIAATILLLWSRHAGIGKVTTSMCNAVLYKLGHAEKNRARSLRGCPWIQVRDDGLRLNPAQVPAAVKLATAFVAKKPLS